MQKAPDWALIPCMRGRRRPVDAVFCADRSGAETEPGSNPFSHAKSARLGAYSVHERIRAPDTLVRSQVLYPAELHTHIAMTHYSF